MSAGAELLELITASIEEAKHDPAAVRARGDALIEQIGAQLAAEGVRIAPTRLRSIMQDHERDQLALQQRTERRLYAAGQACEAVERHGGRVAWCSQLGGLQRDGRRVCRRHAAAAAVRFD